MSAAPISDDFLIVCEGEGDQAFFRHLCADRGIQGFKAEITGKGNSGFLSYFQGLLGRTGIERLKGIVVVSDNDNAPDDSFGVVRDQLKKAKVPYPENALEVVKWTTLDFALSVMMIPFSAGKCQTGCLETLLLDSVTQKFPDLRDCCNEYAACVGADHWANAQSIDKMRLRCMLSAAWEDDPNLGLQYALNPTKALIPLGHQSFDEIAAFLAAFPDLAAGTQRHGQI